MCSSGEGEDLERADGHPFVAIHPCVRQCDADHQVDRLLDVIRTFVVSELARMMHGAVEGVSRTSAAGG
jgi:hypothetical protein